MQYDVTAPEMYLDALDGDWRKETLELLRAIILQKNSKIQESISYKMLAYGDETNTIFRLNAQKNYVSLYVSDITMIDPSGELYQNLNIGKGCIRFSKSTKIADTYINDFIEKTIKMWLAGESVNC